MSRHLKAQTYPPLFPALGGNLAVGEWVVDSFAGGGGASLGIERALGRPINHAINHDPVALNLHRVNHPHTAHSIEDVWHVDPREVCGDHKVGLLWLSPDCKHHSKAKGGKPVEKGIRGLAWVALRWVHYVRPRIIILENVEEFQKWGRLNAEGKPSKDHEGETFQSFVNAFRRHGYAVEWRELRACDYGAPTIRKRLFLVARRDGLPIVWPEPTHADPSDPRVRAGRLQPYKTAAECIDWSLPCPSIFARKRPLVANTMNRIAQGMRRFVLEAEQPFIVRSGHYSNITGEGAHFRGQSIDQPLSTVTASSNDKMVVDPLLIPAVLNKQYASPPRSAAVPLSTVTTNHNKNELLVCQLATYYGPKRSDEVRGQDGRKPLHVQTTENRHSAVVAHMVQMNGGKLPPADANYSAARPTRVITAQGGPQCLVASTLVSYYGSEQDGNDVQAGLRTIPTRDRHALTTATLMRQFGTSTAAAADAPVGTITSQGQGKTGAITADLSSPPLTDEQREKGECVTAFLTEYLGADTVAPYVVDGLVMLTVQGQVYALVDIGLRMLTPRELARCQGFPDAYVLDRTAEGRSISKAAQVRAIGNSVCPQMAEVLTRAQFEAQAQEAAD